MAGRRSIAAVLGGFLLATGVQFLLHAHLADERHHGPDCEDAASPAANPGDPPAGAPTWTAGGDAAASRPALPHASCGRCVTPAGDLRHGLSRLAAPGYHGSAEGGANAAWPEPSARFEHELRGPPRACPPTA